MANTIRIKRRTSGGAGAPASLKNAELAFNEVNQVLYYGRGDDGNGNATSVIAIGGVGWDSSPSLSGYAALAGNNTFTGVNTFGAASTLDIAGTWKIDNVTVNVNAAELNVLDAVTAGSAAANKALVLDASKNINGINALSAASVTTSGSGVIGGSLTVTGTLTVGGGTVAYTTNTLAVFAATTSAQLAGVISDDTGSGSLVFATSPVFTTSVLTGSTTFAVFNTTATTINAFGAATTLNIGASTGTTTVNNDIQLGAGKALKLPGATSGLLTIAGPAIAGTNTITFPAETGTVVTTASACAAIANCTLDGGTF